MTAIVIYKEFNHAPDGFTRPHNGVATQTNAVTDNTAYKKSEKKHLKVSKGSYSLKSDLDYSKNLKQILLSYCNFRVIF